MPLVQTRGAASAQGFGEFAQAIAVNYIEEVFSTYLYTGNDTSQTITNGIDLSTKGGLVWIKSRAGTYVREHYLYDTARGTILSLSTDTNAANVNNSPNGVSAYNTTGFNIVGSGGSGGNGTGTTYCSWTFREQPKFFDVVTWTGTGSNTTIAHSLGSVPGSIIVKRTDTTAAWAVYHRSLANTQYLVLNTTAAAATGATWWNSTTPTSAVFSVGTDASVNASGGTYVAYIFAHDAGGFGLTGTDNVISCGTFTTSAGGAATVTLGYEPQWMLLKQSSGTAASWTIVDSMRGFVSGPATTTSDDATLNPNNANAEGINNVGRPTATGFEYGGSVASQTFIYIAIRRGPMKVPTVGTSVYAIDTLGGTLPNPPGFNGVLVDFAWKKIRTGASEDWFAQSRLTGTNEFKLNATDAATDAADITFDFQDGWNTSASSLSTQLSWMFRRAPSFMDVVCYTGNDTSNSQTHNLTAPPELVIIKRRNAANNWVTLYGFSVSTYNYFLPGPNGTAASNSGAYGSGAFLDSQPTATQLPITSSASQTNAITGTYIAFLFATCAGVSKVGSYTGTGALQTIDCGFTSGVRFVLIKRTDTTGDWWTYNSFRGITSGNDPYMLVNSTAAEVTTTNYVDTTAVGFQVTAAAPAGLNASGGTYIFLAIA